MIYINLLPIRELKKRITAKRQIYFFISFVVIFFALISSYSWYQFDSIGKLTSEEKRLNDEKNKYNKILTQIKKIDEEIKTLENRISVIKTLKKESSITVHVLDELANLTPSKRIWLKAIDQASSRLSISGMALDDQTIASYMDDLEKSNYIGNITLSNTTMDKFAERNLKSFSISCSVGIEPNK